MKWLRFALTVGICVCAHAQTTSAGSGKAVSGRTLNGAIASPQCLHANTAGQVIRTGGNCVTGGTTAGTTAASVPSVLDYGADPTGATDSTVAFNAAEDANQAGTIFVPAGTYTISSTLNFNLYQYLKGAGDGASILNCTMLSSPCIVFAGPAMSSTTSGMSDLQLSGPGKQNAGATGVYLGGDPSGSITPGSYFGNFVNFTNVSWYNFGSCVKWGNNAWLNGFSSGGMNNCAIGMNAPSGVSNSGENTQISRFVIYNGGTPIFNHGGFDFNISSTSFDYNTSFISITGGALHVTNSHFEQSSGAILQVPYGSPIVDIQQSRFLLSASSGTDTDFFDLYPQTMQLVLNADDVYSNHPVAAFVHTGGTINGSITNLSGNGASSVGSLLQPGSSQPTLVVQGFSGAPSAGFGAIGYAGAGGITQYLPSPTTAGHTFVAAWQPNGSAVVPTTLDLTAYMASSSAGSTPVANGSSIPANAGLALANAALGTPSSLVLTNASGLPCSALPALTGAFTTEQGQCVTVAAIAHTTFTNATTPIAANSCSAGAATVTVTGLATSSTLFITPSMDVSEATGFGATGGLVIDAWPSAANTASYKICNQTGSAITPSAVTWNITGT